jgi:uncharacterized protein (DUF433 family)
MIERIIFNTNQCGGRPCRGMRIRVKDVFDLKAAGVSDEKSLEDYPYLEPEDIAASVLFLCSPAARMINGTTLVVDAAATQHRWPDFNTEDLFDEVMGEFAGPAPR